MISLCPSPGQNQKRGPAQDRIHLLTISTAPPRSSSIDSASGGAAAHRDANVLRSTQMRAEGVLKAVSHALEGRADVELAMVFGSRARGDHRSGSDVDVAVLGQVDRLTLAAELSRATGHEVDVVDLAEAGYPLLAAIAQDGVPVHEGRRAAYARWRSHALSQLDLDRAWYARMRGGYLAKLAGGVRG